MVARILIIAGSDSGGGAGIQADIKTVTALGGFAMTAITAVTVQNTVSVAAVHEIPAPIITGQIAHVLADLGADVIKTGMLASVEVIDAVAVALSRTNAKQPRVVDPVMVATSGDSLLKADAVDALRVKLILGAAVLTPNLPEAEVLTGRRIRTLADMDAAVPALRGLGADAVVLKGGHVEGDLVRDLLIEANGVTSFDSPRVHGRATHGTGCTLASAIATGIGQGLALEHAVARARAYVREAMRTAPQLGAGHGPLNHGFTARPFEV